MGDQYESMKITNALTGNQYTFSYPADWQVECVMGLFIFISDDESAIRLIREGKSLTGNERANLVQITFLQPALAANEITLNELSQHHTAEYETLGATINSSQTMLLGRHEVIVIELTTPHGTLSWTYLLEIEQQYLMVNAIASGKQIKPIAETIIASISLLTTIT